MQSAKRLWDFVSEVYWAANFSKILEFSSRIDGRRIFFNFFTDFSRRFQEVAQIQVPPCWRFFDDAP